MVWVPGRIGADMPHSELGPDPVVGIVPRPDLGADVHAGTSEKREGADFDALARPGMRLSGRVVEGGVSSEPGAAVLHRIIDLEDERLVRPHVRKPVPAMRW